LYISIPPFSFCKKKRSIIIIINIIADNLTVF